MSVIQSMGLLFFFFWVSQIQISTQGWEPLLYGIALFGKGEEALKEVGKKKECILSGNTTDNKDDCLYFTQKSPKDEVELVERPQNFTN